MYRALILGPIVLTPLTLYRKGCSPFNTPHVLKSFKNLCWVFLWFEKKIQMSSGDSG